MRFAIAGARVFDGTRLCDGKAVLVEDGRVAAMVGEGDIPAQTPVTRVTGVLAPGFIDVQVNGGGGVNLNAAPTLETIRTIGAAHRRFGTTGFLPTLITDTRETMRAAVEAVRAGLAADVPGLLGVHLEGPFLNPQRKGVHDTQFMRPIEDADIAIMTSLGAGRTLVTLAPECVPPGTIARLAQAGVIVAAGHTTATYDQLTRARAEGLRGYTHLFNAMPPLMGREPGPVGAALDERETFVSIIADLHHVGAPALRLALAMKGAERLMLITDAMATVGTDMPGFALQGRQVFRRDGRLTTADGTLAGSDLDMARAVRIMAGEGGATLEQALAMASRAPAEFLRLGDELGRIAPGARADLVLLDTEGTVTATWIAGIANDG